MLTIYQCRYKNEKLLYVYNLYIKKKGLNNISPKYKKNLFNL